MKIKTVSLIEGPKYEVSDETGLIVRWYFYIDVVAEDDKKYRHKHVFDNPFECERLVNSIKKFCIIDLQHWNVI
jgi:hypothetical protein